MLTVAILCVGLIAVVTSSALWYWKYYQDQGQTSYVLYIGSESKNDPYNDA